MTYPTLLPRTLGVDWTITIDPVDPSEPPTGWTSMTVGLRSGPTEDFDLLATSRTIAGPLSQTIDTTGSDPDAAEIRLVVEASATALIPPPGCKGEEGFTFLQVRFGTVEALPVIRIPVVDNLAAL